MLILADTDGHRFYLDELRQRILQPAGNGNCRTQVYVIVRKLFRCKRRGRVDGCTGFVDHRISLIAADAPQHFRSHLFSLTGSRAVADSQMSNMVFFNERCQLADSRFFFYLAEGRIDDSGIKNFSGAVHHGHFASVFVPWVEAHSHLAFHWRLHQQWLQVLGEHFYRSIAGHSCKR